MQKLHSLPLNGLRAVDAVARLRSLRAAAGALGVSPGAVSQQITRCEEILGHQLFERRPGGMIPLSGMEEVFRLLEEGFASIAAAVELTRRDRAQILTISAPPIFAARWLIWRLPDFTRAHPEIRVRIDSELALVDPNKGDVDFAIRVGPGHYPNVHAERLLHQFVTPVCSPEVAKRIRTPADLARVPIIRDDRAMFTWEAWLAPEGMHADMLQDGPVFNEASLGLDAAMSGEGVLLAFETLCHDAIAQGRVVAPIPRWHPTGFSYWLISARGRSLSTPQRQFRSWLKDSLASSGMGLGDQPRA
ncbi:LysR family transcriptional regulator [Pseudooceanicola sp. CBS1P-1]|uniref:LysR family transcriptional regulator n=1 Tax=Pseudooceanicola albus TaxID=2692189 RepID=A0A6L7FXY5_9RHOB|nr:MULTISPECIES: LysR substrate-binding domain-containing protein [Pseudooceanicola]MBT9384049.1 LysR family transcriptional regulator [Pseudooceanicola endophyticus]MXN16539.1 LysR family transcriptional regulator [Pseudooceanicola albus]